MRHKPIPPADIRNMEPQPTFLRKVFENKRADRKITTNRSPKIDSAMAHYPIVYYSISAV
jgi:hypothetical protein